MKTARYLPLALVLGSILTLTGVLVCAGVLEVSAVVGGIAALAWPSETRAELVARTWSREIVVEAYTSVSESAWDERVPEDAYQVECKRKKRGDRYDKRCTYLVDRWIADRTERVEGGISDPPAWPEPKVNPCEILACTRLGDRKEVWRIELRQPGTRETEFCNLTEHRWRAAEEGLRLDVKENLAAGVLCSSVEKAIDRIGSEGA